MNILFITNFELTSVQIEVSKRLQGVDAFFLCVSQHTSRICLKEGIHASRIIDMDIRSLSLPEPLAHLDSESGIDPITTKDIFAIDRYLRYRSAVEQESYEFILSRLVKACVNSGFFSLIFGEATWAHELALSRACSRVAVPCRFFSPAVMRYPSGRFGFFEGEFQEAVFGPDTLSDIQASSVAEDSISLEKPYYLEINNQKLEAEYSLKGILHRLNNFLTNRNVEPLNPCTMPRRSVRLRLVVGLYINAFFYKLILRPRLIPIAELENYVLLPLHKQPERSIDVLGKGFEDQAHLIGLVRRKLPHRWKLVVKEHSNAVGDRGYLFFRAIQRFDDVVLVSEKQDSEELIKNAQAVISVSGTACFEAAIHDVPSFTISRMYFNRLPSSWQLLGEDLLGTHDWAEMIQQKTKQNLTSSGPSSVLAEFRASSFRGLWTDVNTSSSVLSPNNLEDLSVGFQWVIDKQCEREEGGRNWD